MAVDVAAQLMKNKGITPKFTLIELRDNITEHDCGHRGQSRKFNQLDILTSYTDVRGVYALNILAALLANKSKQEILLEMDVSNFSIP